MVRSQFSEAIKFIRRFNPAEPDWENLPKEVFNLETRLLSPSDKGMLEAIKIAYTVDHKEQIFKGIKSISNIYKGIKQILF